MGKTTASPQTLLELLEPEVQALGYELVDVDCRTGGRDGLLRLYIDCEAGVTLDDCERVSRQISAVLDVEDPMPGQYTLEVSSPGLDRVLRTPEHFERFSGAEVKVELHAPLDGRRRFRGLLKGMDGDAAVVTVDGQDWKLPLNMIEKARLVPVA